MADIGLPAMQDNEGAMQYNLRVGMDPNTAANVIASAMTGNGMGATPNVSPVSAARSRADYQNYATNAVRASYQAQPEFGWFGGKQVASPITLNSQAGNVVGYGSDGKPITQTETYSQGPRTSYYGQPGSVYIPPAMGGGSKGTTLAPGQAPTTGSVQSKPYWQGQQPVIGTMPPQASPVAATKSPVGLPNIMANEDSAAYMKRIGMNDNAIQYATALSKANPKASFQDIMQYMDNKQKQTATQGATNAGLPAINAGEDSASYMRRIGMSDSAIAQAQGIAKANPGASFQQIMEFMRTKATTPASSSPLSASEVARRKAWDDYYARIGQTPGTKP